MKNRRLSNPLAASRPPADRYERLWDALFARYERIDTTESIDLALRNVEQARAAAESWVGDHTDKAGKWTGAAGRSPAMMLALEDSFACEAHALALLSSVYSRRAELLAAIREAGEDVDGDD